MFFIYLLFYGSYQRGRYLKFTGSWVSAFAVFALPLDNQHWCKQGFYRIPFHVILSLSNLSIQIWFNTI